MASRVLIVDDEDYIRRILAFKLERAGFVTLEAASADAAEHVLEDSDVDLMLLDVGLATPTNGFDLAARLRRNARTEQLPIILLTARGFASDVLRGREIGAAGYITKPFSTDEVIRRVRAILDVESS
jgi:two-component system phosphate regulon response regulator PhoB